MRSQVSAGRARGRAATTRARSPAARSPARMKFLVINHGWTVDSFLAGIERRIGYALGSAVEETPPAGSYRDHLGVRQQKQAGLHYASFSVLSGRITPEQLRRIASLADTYGDGSLRLTTTQNIVVLNVPTDQLPAFEHAAEASGGGGGIPLQ